MWTHVACATDLYQGVLGRCTQHVLWFQTLQSWLQPTEVSCQHYFHTHVVWLKNLCLWIQGKPRLEGHMFSLFLRRYDAISGSQTTAQCLQPSAPTSYWAARTKRARRQFGGGVGIDCCLQITVCIYWLNFFARARPGKPRRLSATRTDWAKQRHLQHWTYSTMFRQMSQRSWPTCAGRDCCWSTVSIRTRCSDLQGAILC